MFQHSFSSKKSFLWCQFNDSLDAFPLILKNVFIMKKLKLRQIWSIKRQRILPSQNKSSIK